MHEVVLIHRYYLQGAHGQCGDGLTLGHHGVHRLEGVLQAAVGDVRLTGHVVDVLDGRVSLRVRHADLVGRDRLHPEGSLRLGKGPTEVHESGLRELLHADVVLRGVVFRLGPQGGGGVGHEDVAAAVGEASLGLSPSEIGIQLLEEFPLADVHGFATGWVDSSRQPALLPLQGEGVAGVLGNGLHVALAGVGWQGVEVGAHGERQLRGWHLLFRGALHPLEERR